SGAWLLSTKPNLFVNETEDRVFHMALAEPRSSIFESLEFEQITRQPLISLVVNMRKLRNILDAQHVHDKVADDILLGGVIDSQDAVPLAENIGPRIQTAIVRKCRFDEREKLIKCAIDDASLHVLVIERLGISIRPPEIAGDLTCRDLVGDQLPQRFDEHMVTFWRVRHDLLSLHPSV